MPNVVDRAIEWLSPTRALRRAQSRAKLDLVARAYNAASTAKRLSDWAAPLQSATREIGAAGAIARDRARDAVRNNPYCARALDSFETNIVGPGIVPTLTGPNAEQLDELYRAWAGSSECDADGQHDMAGLQGLAQRSLSEAGETLVRPRRRRVADGLTVPLQIQVLEPDFLDSTKDDVYASVGAPRNVQGVRFNGRGKRIGYHLFPFHPGDSTTSLESKYIRAEELFHLYRCDRPGQVRGMTWFAPVMIVMRELEKYLDAEQVRHTIAACFAAFIHDISADVDQAPPVLDSEGNVVAEPVTESIIPGGVHTLPHGKAVTLADPPRSPDLTAYVVVMLHRAAVGLGITYEELTGDLKGVNFSSGRLGHIAFARNVHKWQTKTFVPGFCSPVFEAFRVAASIATATNFQAVKVEWRLPIREMIEPTKEIAALKDKVRNGFESLFGAIQTLGRDPATVLEEIAKGNELVDSLGIVLDTDPRVEAAAASQMADAAAQAGATEESGDEEKDEEDEEDGAEDLEDKGEAEAEDAA